MTIENFGQYILLEKIAVGGMAELFKAKKIGIEGFERLLAIKRILPHLSADEEFISMFIAEAKLVARLNHRNIVQVFDFGKTAENYFITMEYVKGKDLKAILKKCGDRDSRLPVALAAYIAKETATALSYAHGQRDSSGKSLDIIHRDISPQNILISYEGEVKVVDFGIAKASTHAKTNTGLLKGKLAYMSPEQAWGKPIDSRSDIFSLGVVLYEMLTGQRLFKGDTELNTLEKVRAAQIEILPSFINADVPPHLEAQTLKALQKEIHDRYQSASELASDLSKTLVGLLAEPSQKLKQFMHDLFREEIEAERRAEMQDETVRIQYERRPVPMASEEHERAPAPVKKKPVGALVALLALAIIAAMYFLWPHQAIKSSVQTLAKSAPQRTGQSLAEQESQKPSGALSASPDEETGGLVIAANPGATVYVNGERRGSTPMTLDTVRTGKYRIRLENPDFSAWETIVTVRPGRTAKISHTFSKFGTLVVNAIPWGRVYLDGNPIGQTPLTVENIPARVYELRVSREGYADFTKTLEIKNGATERISVKLNKETE